MNWLSRTLKSSWLLYNVYFCMMSVLLKLLGSLVGSDEEAIRFNSYGGKQYSDSPRAIYEHMATDARFEDFRLVWALHRRMRFACRAGRRSYVRTASGILSPRCGPGYGSPIPPWGGAGFQKAGHAVLQHLARYAH